MLGLLSEAGSMSIWDDVGDTSFGLLKYYY